MPHPSRAQRGGRRGRSVTRRWCLPPAITRDENESLDYSDILSEFNGDVGLLLWMAARNVTLWASVEPEHRAGLFDAKGAQRLQEAFAGVKLDARVEMALMQLNVLLTDPDTIEPDTVELMCIDLSKWAEERMMLGSAIAFAQAAALAQPENPKPAVRVGQLALRSGTRSARAETWVRRAIGLARRRKEWDSYTVAYITLADIYIERGKFAAASTFLTTARRAARRHGLLQMRGEALHRLLRIKMGQGELAEARQLSKLALRAYGRTHPGIPDLLLDTAELMTLTGAHLRSIALLRRLLVGVDQRARRARILAIMARAAAGAVVSAEATVAKPTKRRGTAEPAQPKADAPGLRVGRETYEQAWSDAWLLVTGPAAAKDPAILLDLARAAAVIRDTPRLDQAARLARSRLPARIPGLPSVTMLSALDDLTSEFIRDKGPGAE